MLQKLQRNYGIIYKPRFQNEYLSHDTELTCTIPCLGMLHKLKLEKDFLKKFYYVIKTSKGY